MTRYSRLMRDIIKTGVKTKVLMLSATPVNNRMNDLKNQVAFIAEGAEKEAIVAEGFQATGWLDLSNPTENQAAFLESLNITTWPHTHFFAFYRAAMDRVIALAYADYSGHYSLKIPNGRSADDRVHKLKQVEKFQQEKAEIQGKLKREKNLGTQVQLNIRIKQITDSIEAIKREL